MSTNTDPSTWRLRTASGIRYKLMEGFPTGTFEDENATAEEQYIIQAPNLFAFVLESFPPPIVIGNFFINLPKRSFPSLVSLQTKRISYQPFEDGRPSDPFGIDLGAPDGTYADFLLVTISYATGKNSGDDNNPTTFLEISSSATGEIITIPTTGNNFGSPTGDPVQDGVVPVSQVIPETEWTVRWSQIPNTFFDVLLNVMRPLMGRVSSVPMPLLRNADASTILFMGWSHEEQFTWKKNFVDAPPIQVEMHFVEKNLNIDGFTIGHNHFYNPKTGAWEQLFNAKGELVYRSGNLNKMFPPSVG
ncbi:hypothetical protein LCGC14_0249440 [marine sediment metagenome]|uniref:Uncharacterized protein n=1 Tax=marine sediment metagenome TaxID=412755 RepID=A0A0F9WQB1_9ZZZZ